MSDLILVTGASGYIAGRLIPRLLERGVRVRALARRPGDLAARIWARQVEFVRGDVTDPASLGPALEGVHTAYYLIHNMASGSGYLRIELEAARNFAHAAQRLGVQHIIYLGGLADPHDRHIAAHMLSRIQTGETLREGKVPVTEFRAGVIVGSGSISFEMIRFLTEFFPILPGPDWLRNHVQPISARNVIDYLVAALDHPGRRGGIHEIGGPDEMHYADAMLRYAKLRGLHRLLFTLPGIPVGLMARFVDALTPVPASIAVPLIGGLRSDSVVHDPGALQAYPEVERIPFQQALAEALEDLRPERIERIWEVPGRDSARLKHEGFFIDYRRTEVHAPASSVYAVLTSLGGPRGWPYADPLWTLRGWMDRLFGGPGLRRPAPSVSKAGDILDYYRVERLEADHLMRLYAELRAPGLGWMEWRLDPCDGQGGDSQRSVLTQTAFFAPRGLPGFLYWFLLGPLHRLVFRGLIQAIRRQSEAR